MDVIEEWHFFATSLGKGAIDRIKKTVMLKKGGEGLQRNKEH